MKSLLKNIVEKNSSLLTGLRYVPFKFRLGTSYTDHCSLIGIYSDLSIEQKEAFHFDKLKTILFDAYNNNPFYRYFYDLHSYNPHDFTSLEFFRDVPIVSKSILKEYDIKKRSCNRKGALLVNTGGTSGKPLDFYLDRGAFSREWAYMHNIWMNLDYSYLDYKLTFRGKDNKGIPLKYNVIHNEFIVDSYVSPQDLLNALYELNDKYEVKYIHGYPSTIYAFCKYLKEQNICPHSLFNGALKGVFFGSEYPAPLYRDLVENILQVPTISWYGHSEMCILAYEKGSKFTYHPFQTYGFTESVEIAGHSESHLVGTSYYNNCSHFIRYDTEDLITDETFEGKVLSSFKISKGRLGDFIFDKDNNPISLTSLIFGRHHKCFDKIDYIQVQQPKVGHATLLVTTKNKVSKSDFYLDNIKMEFEVKIIQHPIRTASGKLPLLIK